MRRTAGALALVAIAMGAVGAQAAPSAFVDVPPWHWAFDAVVDGAARGIFTGYPVDDRELVANALVQVYEAFARPTHPAAREWAEWFLTNTPPGWPQPLQRSRLIAFTLEDLHAQVSGDRATATFVAVTTRCVAGPVFYQPGGNPTPPVTDGPPPPGLVFPHPPQRDPPSFSLP